MTDSTILLHGGTDLSQTVASGLHERGITPEITVTRESAKSLYPRQLQRHVHVGELNDHHYRKLINDLSPSAVLDVTHPFADRISRRSLRITDQESIPYLYVDRKDVLPEQDEALLRVDTWEEAINRTKNFKKILLTVGIKRLHLFTENVPRSKLLIRVLPKVESFQKTNQLEIPPERILALWPPVDASIEEAILRKRDVDLMVSKDSGKTGGLDQKWAAIKRTDATLLVINRPSLPYRERTTDPGRAVEWGNDHATS